MYDEIHHVWGETNNKECADCYNGLYNLIVLGGGFVILLGSFPSPSQIPFQCGHHGDGCDEDYEETCGGRDGIEGEVILVRLAGVADVRGPGVDVQQEEGCVVSHNQQDEEPHASPAQEGFHLQKKRAMGLCNTYTHAHTHN